VAITFTVTKRITHECTPFRISLAPPDIIVRFFVSAVLLSSLLATRAALQSRRNKPGLLLPSCASHPFSNFVDSRVVAVSIIISTCTW